MERYCMAFSSDPQKWSEDIVKKMTELPFECVNILGEGANCSVHSLRPRRNPEEGRCEEEEEEDSESHHENEDWVDKYFNLNDIVVTSDEPSDSESDCEPESGEYSSHEDEPSEEWSDVRPDGTTQTAHECFMTESPMGTVEVVAKKF